MSPSRKYSLSGCMAISIFMHIMTVQMDYLVVLLSNTIVLAMSDFPLGAVGVWAFLAVGA